MDRPHPPHGETLYGRGLNNILVNIFYLPK